MNEIILMPQHRTYKAKANGSCGRLCALNESLLLLATMPPDIVLLATLQSSLTSVAAGDSVLNCRCKQFLVDGLGYYHVHHRTSPFKPAQKRIRLAR